MHRDYLFDFTLSLLFKGILFVPILSTIRKTIWVNLHQIFIWDLMHPTERKKRGKK